jgi:hypothetical protein
MHVPTGADFMGATDASLAYPSLFLDMLGFRSGLDRTSGFSCGLDRTCGFNGLNPGLGGVDSGVVRGLPRPIGLLWKKETLSYSFISRNRLT